MSFYTIKDIERFEREIVRRGISVPENWYAIPLQRKLEVANGIGPSAWSRVARKMSTALQPHAVLGAYVHDVEYCHPVKTKEIFDAANQRFYRNIKLVITQDIAWYRPTRCPLYGICFAEFLAVSRGGWDAFVTGEVIPELEVQEGPETSES